MAASLRVRSLLHAYGDHRVVAGMDFALAPGRIGCLLGPSGCGKTTVLRCIAGFEPIQGGEILLSDRLVSSAAVQVPPERRGIGMVFQDYALFPHLTVARNVAFGLTRLPSAEAARRTDAMLELVGLAADADTYPHELSGGQQQRVALARALVFEPQLVLMDEPLGALDKQLREHMQIELKELHRQLGVTFVYVTHDQGEALTMSDRVAVFNDGLIQQIDRVDRLYETPVNRFVAGFVGDSTVLDGTLGAGQADRGGHCELVLPTGERLLGINVNQAQPGTRVAASVRPERIEAFLSAPADSANVLQAAINDVIYFGDHLRLRCAIAGQAPATVKVPLRAETPQAGQPVWLRVAPEFLRVYA